MARICVIMMSQNKGRKVEALDISDLDFSL